MPINFKRLVAELVARRPEKIFEVDDPRLAVAALMFHVIAVDGEVTPHERSRWIAELARRYALPLEEAEALAAAGRAAELETADLKSFTVFLERRLDPAGRRDVVRTLWSMVLADGEAHEFEDNVVWRIADLLGIEASERVSLRKEAEAEHAAAATRAAEEER